MTITGFTHGTSEDVPLQRFEVFTGTGRRRDWSDEEKDRIVAESYSGEMSVSAVARRHGLSPGQLFTWRRQVRSQAKQDSPSMFVPAVIDRPAEPPPTRRKTIEARTSKLWQSSWRLAARSSGSHLARSATIAAVIQALKAQS
ncbi:IS66-like element accessory protein TnpA [Rhizobium laguerreae]|uniref:IS66-like element accessory protein TnpA n=1 Tax=Rhizobium laguerreae TaxID=1076926 RepID=UPI00197CD878|nr:transposase [Rhizobium laguerreae]